MTLHFTNKALQAMHKLPKSTFNKVLDFQQKFLANSKSDAINLESIHDFVDPQLRTARIDDKYRAIIAAPKTGTDYVLMWVDNHDEAMNWAKNKYAEWNEHVQVFQVYEAPPTEQKPAPAVTPVAVYQTPPTLYQAVTDEQLLKIGVPTRLLPAVRALADLNDLEDLMGKLPEDAFGNLFALADGGNIERLIAEVEEGKVAEADALNSPNNRRFFFRLSGDDDALRQALSGDFSEWVYFLHPQQRLLVEANAKGPIKVSGGAGTGKTVAALHRLRHLIAVHNPDRPVLFTTFTKSLTDNLDTLIKGLGVDPKRYVVLNIDALASQLARQYSLTGPNHKIAGWANSLTMAQLWAEFLTGYVITYDAAFLQAEYEQVFLPSNFSQLAAYYAALRVGRGQALYRQQRAEVWQVMAAFEAFLESRQYNHKEGLFNKLTNHLRSQPQKPYSHVIVDEVQDFSSAELRLVRALTEEKPNDLFLVGDPLQRIYNRRMNFTQAGIHIKGSRSRRLRINYRTSEEIRRFAIDVVANQPADDFNGGTEEVNGYRSLFHGAAPAYHIFNSQAAELEFLIEQIQEQHQQGIAYADIVVAGRFKPDTEAIRNALHKRGLPYVELGGKVLAADGVRLCALQGLKGLEFKSVFLMNIHQQTMPYVPASLKNAGEAERQQLMQQERALMYVAASRAVHTLTVTGVGNRAEWLA